MKVHAWIRKVNTKRQDDISVRNSKFCFSSPKLSLIAALKWGIRFPMEIVFPKENPFEVRYLLDILWIDVLFIWCLRCCKVLIHGFCVDKRVLSDLTCQLESSLLSVDFLQYSTLVSFPYLPYIPMAIIIIISSI